MGWGCGVKMWTGSRVLREVSWCSISVEAVEAVSSFPVCTSTSSLDALDVSANGISTARGVESANVVGVVGCSGFASRAGASSGTVASICP